MFKDFIHFLRQQETYNDRYVLLSCKTVFPKRDKPESEADSNDTYTEFPGRMFAERGKFLDKTVAEIIYRMFDGCTWYMQMMMNELFALTKEGMICTPEYVDFAWENIIMAQEDRFQAILYGLAPKQKQLLYAIAKDKKVEGITSSEFVKKHRLVSASSVQAALKPLMKNDIVTCDEGIYRIYDYFFADYLAKLC